MPRIKLTDESLNSHGSRVLTDGIDMSLFMKNPVLFYQHDDWYMPLGKWTDIRKDADGSISAVPEFDPQDEMAQKLEWKVEKGYINAASIGLRALELSDDPRHLVEGQTRPTITKSLLLEVSIVNFPANRNAVRMSMEGLLADQIAMVHRMVAVEEKDKPTGDPGKRLITKPEMKEIAKALGLSADATEAECLAALNAQAAKAKDTEASLSAARTALKTLAEATVTKLGRADLKDRAGKLAEDVNGDALSILLETVPAPAQTSLKAGLTLGGSPKDERANWSLTDWRKKDPAGLATMRSEKPETYEALVANLSKA